MHAHSARFEIRSARFVALTLMAGALAACGGGGGGGGSNPAPTFSVGGTVSGLATGATLVLLNNGLNNLTVAANGAFTFSNLLSSGASYAVTIATQPAAPSQNCTVASGTGTISGNVASVTITCTTNSFAVGGTVGGLATGASVVLQRNGANNLTVTANGNFSFPAVASGTTYAVTVLTQPTSPAQTCTVANGTGTVAAAAVANVAVTCVTNPVLTFTIGGTVTGLAGTGLTLQNNGGNNLPIAASGAFAFTTPIATGAGYAVTVLAQPTAPAQTCVVTSGTGTVGSANVTNVAVNCTNNTFTVGGSVSGLSGAGLVLQNNAGNNLAIAANGAFTFTTPVAAAAGYVVTVLTQPTAPAQTCAVSNGSGTIVNANIVNVAVTCTTATYTIGGTLSGLGASSSVVLRNTYGSPSQTSDLTVSANGAFTFSTPVASGGAYAVTVQTNPQTPARTCLVTAGGNGTVAAANVTSVIVICRSKYMFQSHEQGTDSVSSYAIAAATGAVTLVDNETRGEPNLDKVSGLAVTPSGNHLFISLDFVAPANGAIATYLVNADGTMTDTGNIITLPVGTDPTGANPKAIMVSPNGQHVYVFDGPNGAIHHYTFNAINSTLSFIGTQTVNGLYAIYMEPTGKFLFAGSYDDLPAPGTDDPRIWAFVVDQVTGVLTPAAGPATIVGTTSSELVLTGDAAGKFLFVGNQRDATVLVYSIHPTLGTLAFQDSESTASPPVTPGPVSMVVDPSSQFLYAALNNHTVLAFTIHATTGALTPLVNNPFLTQANPTLTGVDFRLGIDASGQYLYQTSYADGLMIVFSVNRTTGALTEVVGPAISPWPFPVYEGVSGIAFE